MRRFFRFLAGGLAVLIVLAALAVWVLEEPPGQRLVARALSHVLSSPSQRIVIAGLSGILPFDVHVVRITVSNPEGVRAIVENANAEIAPAALLSGRLDIERLAIGSVALPGTAAGEGASGLDAAALLNPPLPVTVKAFSIDRIALGQPVLGVPLTLGLNGGFALGGGRAEAQLGVSQIGGQASAKLELAYEDGRLSVDAAAREPSGAVLAALLGRTAPLPFQLAVKGAGPLDDWQGNAAFSAGSEATANLRLTISGTAPYRIALDGTADVAALLPPKLHPLARGTLRLAAEASVNAASVALDRLQIMGPEQFSAHGRYTRATGALAGEARLSFADLAPLAPLARVPIGGSATLALDLGGTVEAPTATLTLDAANLQMAQARIAAAHVALDAKAAPGAPIELSGSG
ncbi:MAG: hypothetical protein ACREFQ_13675, partial [Stellaceae bacterium]